MKQVVLDAVARHYQLFDFDRKVAFEPEARWWQLVLEKLMSMRVFPMESPRTKGVDYE